MSRHTAKVCCLVYHPQKPLFASCSYDQTIQLWDEQGQWVRSLIGHKGALAAAVFHPDRPMLISGGLGKMICFWDTETGHLLETMTLPVGARNIYDTQKRWIAESFYPIPALTASAPF